MVKLIERKKIFENYKTIASEISMIQEVSFDNEIYLEIECEKEKMEYEKYSVKYDIKVLSAKYNEIKTFPKFLYGLLLKLCEEIDINELFILTDLKIDYYGSLFNKFKPLVKAYKQLEKITGKKYYDEAFYLTKLSEEIVDIIFWLSRCSPQMNNIIFFDKMERFYFSICQYGNIHMTGLGGNTISENIIKKLGLTIIEGRETDNFTNDGKINGRRIKV